MPPPRTRPAEPARLVLYEDPLSPWCLVAERRIQAVLEELPGAYGPLVLAPFPLRDEPRALTPRERRAYVRAARKASREPEAAGTLPDLWLSDDPPVSTLPALAALEAARQQGLEREAALRAALRDAALARGINVTRRDVLIELAAASGLDVARFDGCLESDATQRTVIARWDDALAKGVESAPALVIDEEWLVAGPRTMAQYRAILKRYASACLGLAGVRVVH